MSRLLQIVVLVVTLSCLGCSGISKAPAAKTLTLSELENGGEALAKEMFGDGAIVHIKTGETLPVTATVDLPFAELVAGENRLSFKQDVYLYVSRTGIMLSPDGVSFAPIGRFKSIKRLFGASKGTVQIGFKVEKDKGPSAAVGLSLK